MNRWGALGIGVGVVALGLVLAGRLQRPAPEVVPKPFVQTDTLVFHVNDRGVEPAMATVGKDHRVRLTVVNATARPVAAQLPGYDDQVAIPPLAAGAAWSGEFTADRPGADFALWIDGEPAARLNVAGSHLVEGHR